MLALLAEVARSRAYPDKEVALAKTNALQSLKANEATPRFRAERALAQAVFGDHAYGRTLPTAESITAATPELLRAEHARLAWAQAQAAQREEEDPVDQHPGGANRRFRISNLPIARQRRSVDTPSSGRSLHACGA